MRVRISSKQVRSDLVKKVEEISGQNFLLCYQCGKCSAGCPMSFAMDILPSQILRFAQLGLLEDIAQSKTIWLCASCFTCMARCPRGVDLSKIMEALRLLVLRSNEDYVHPDKMSKE
ncbi:MAG: 4Fe-4S dicluster domain-containing protein, partial [Thermodesulfobacteriota bacterium]|nr:4Fe-4S dicluster domain-containing protein [Thermodesulfobacteriota bacterium]